MSAQDNAIIVTRSPLAAELAEVWDRTMNAPTILAEVAVDADTATLAIMALETLKTRLGELADIVEQTRQKFGLEQVKRLGDALFPYYAGVERTVHCKDVKATMNYLLQVLDIDGIIGLLSSNAIKQGAFREVLGDSNWAQFFEVREGPKLKESESKRAAEIKLLKATTFLTNKGATT